MLRALLLLATLQMGSMSAVEKGALLNERRIASGDLEVGGQLAGSAPDSTRFIRYQDLLKLPLETYTVTDDGNFHGGTKISGVALEALAAAFGDDADTVVAICDDGYRTNYPPDYLAAHHPLLVLRINGEPPERWPVSESGGSMGPFEISHPFFKPAFRVLSHDDEAQVPYGVIRLDFRREAQVFSGIRPAVKVMSDAKVRDGYAIARQDCFRCHNMGAEGGTMSGRSWTELGKMAKENGERFRAIIRDPKSVIPGAKMPGQPGYDVATLGALTAYYKTFWPPDPAERVQRKR